MQIIMSNMMASWHGAQDFSRYQATCAQQRRLVACPLHVFRCVPLEPFQLRKPTAFCVKLSCSPASRNKPTSPKPRVQIASTSETTSSKPRNQTYSNSEQRQPWRRASSSVLNLATPGMSPSPKADWRPSPSCPTFRHFRPAKTMRVRALRARVQKATSASTNCTYPR